MVKCTYCGEEEGTEKIISPNFDDDELWDVCKDCKETIKQQQKLSFGAIISSMEGRDNKDREFNEKYGEKIMTEANTEIEKISKRTGKPVMSAMIQKKKDGSYESTSVEFTGE